MSKESYVGEAIKTMRKESYPGKAIKTMSKESYLSVDITDEFKDDSTIE